MKRGAPSPAQLAGQGPKRAFLEILVPKVDKPIIPLCFNPTDYKIEKKNQFAEIAVPGLGSPAIQFVRGESEKLTITDMIADTSDTLEDVNAKFVAELRKLMDINSELHAPPIVRLTWGTEVTSGKEVFEGVLQHLNTTYVLFSPEGVPLRAKLTMTILGHRPVEVQAKVDNKKSPDVEKTWVARRGDTLAGIAAAVFADPRLWREIARANGITDPRRLRPGTVLTVPRLR